MISILLSFFDGMRKLVHCNWQYPYFLLFIFPERSDYHNLKPFSYLVMNLHKPLVSSMPTLLTLEEVHQLFSEFGHGLQQMLTKVPFSEIAGQKNVEWDALYICSTFMTLWLSQPSILRRISSHYQTGESMSDDMIDIILKGKMLLEIFSLINFCNVQILNIFLQYYSLIYLD